MAGYTRNDTGDNISDGNIINASDLDGEFDSIQAAFNDITGHTHDGTVGEGGAIEVVGPEQDIVVTITEVVPKANNTMSLGTAELQFKDLYIDNVANIDSLVADTADINGGTIDNTIIETSDITVGSGKTLDVSAGTLILADNQISGDKVEGGTIASIAISSADINGGTIDGVTIGSASAGAGTFTSVTGTSLNLNGAAVFNEEGADVDFRIESDTNTHAFFVQGSDGNVGINTSTPDTPLHVNGGTINNVATFESTDPFASIIVKDSNSVGANGLLTSLDNIYLTGSNSAFVRVNTIDVLAVEAAASEAMRIKASGNVGINKASPATTLDVGGTVTATGLDLNGNADFAGNLNLSRSGGTSLTRTTNTDYIAINSGSGTAFGSNIVLYAGSHASLPNYSIFGGDTMLFRPVDNSPEYMRFVDGTGTVFNETSADLDFRIESDTNAYAFFLRGSDGNIGINTANPSTNLEVADTTGAAGIEVTAYRNGTTYGNSYIQLNNPRNSSADGGTIDGRASILALGNSSGVTSSLWINAATAGLTPKTATETDMQNQQAGLNINSNGELSFWDNGSKRFLINSSGNVGINNSSPTTALDVTGTVKATAFNGPLTGAVTGNASTATKLATPRNIALGGDLSGSADFDGIADITITATVADDSHNHIISNIDGLQTALDGKLATGAKAADSELLDGINSTSFVRSDANDDKSGFLRMADGAANYLALGTGSDFRMWHDGTNTYFRNYNEPNGDMIWQTEGTGGVVHTAMIVRGNSPTPNVELYYDNIKKIETTSDGATVTGDLTAAGDLVLDATNANIKLKSGATGTTGAVNFTFNTDSSIYGSLSLPYNTRSTVGLLAQSTNGYPVSLSSGTASSAANAVILSTSGAEAMRIDSDGDVGVGTASPESILHAREDQDGTTRAIIQNRLATGTPVSELTFLTGAVNLSDNRYAYIQSAGSSSNHLAFGTSNGSAPVERMRIDESGNITVSGGDIIPSTDGTGNVGTSTNTFSRGWFTNLTVDSTIDVRGAIDLADNDQIRMGSSDDWRLYYNPTGSHATIELEADVADLVITDNGTTRFTFDKSAGSLTSTGSMTASSFVGPLTGNADTATKLATPRSIALGGVLSGSTNFDGSGNITITAAHTSDPTITLTGAVTGSGTMTNLGNVSITTTATSDPTLTLAGDVTGSATFTNLGNATLTATVANDSHTHNFDNLTNKTGGTGDYTTTGLMTAATFNATSTTSGGFQGIGADSATNPSFTWTGDLDTGVYRYSSNQIGFATAGVYRARITNSALILTGNLQFSDGTSFSTAEPGVGNLTSYISGRALAGGPYDSGATISGGNLSPCDLEGYPRVSGGSIVILGGTWRCMGKTQAAGSTSISSQPNQASMWLRIA